MTAEEKTVVTRFLDLAGDYLRDGYSRNREKTDLSEPAAFAAVSDDAAALNQPEARLSSLPLAYQVDENDTIDENSEGPAANSAVRVSTLAELAAAVGECRACPLGAARKLPVPGEGVNNPQVLVIGEGPGAEEDAAGRPFIGRAGQLLDKMLASIGLFRDRNCYIANVVKCRPPNNRDPEPGEIAACFPFLQKQIALLRPRAILCAGRVAAQSVLKTNLALSALRLSATKYGEETPIPVICTYHPSAILREEALKRPAWEDLKQLRSILDSSKELDSPVDLDNPAEE